MTALGRKFNACEWEILKPEPGLGLVCLSGLSAVREGQSTGCE